MATVDPAQDAAPGEATGEANGQPSTLRQRAVKYGTFPLIALASTNFVQSGDTNSIGFAVEGIQDAFHVSDFWVGTIPFAMNLVGLLGVLPFGLLADRWRRTTLLAIGCMIWTVGMGVTGLATSFVFLMLARAFVGGLEATSPAAISLIGDYWPVQKRAAKMGLYTLGAFIGALTAYIVAGAAVELGGWRWAFFVWIPFGIVSTILLLRAPEPRRGSQDLDYAMPVVPGAGSADLSADEDIAHIAELVDLPEPDRVGSGDYHTMTPREALREILRIKSMWFGLVSITVGQLILQGLGFWSIEYFKRVHHLGNAGAGALVAGLALSSAIGILGGGYLSDRLLRRGFLNGRVYIIAIASVLATVMLAPAFASSSLWITAPLFVLGGVMLTLPIAPTEAMMADVVVCDLRGRAAMIRSMIRTLSSAGALVVGGLSYLLGGGTSLRWALVLLMPIYAIGGLIALGARRTYAHDLAFALAETRRTEPYRQARDSSGS
jgi:MFS family permease